MYLLASESSHIFVDENICPTDAFGNLNPARYAILRYKTASHRYDAIDT